MPPPDPSSTSTGASSSSSSSSPSLPLLAAHALLTTFNSFLTASIHTILYYRNVYPKRTFLSARAYSLPVHQNRHPKVCAWVRDAVDAVAAQLSSGTVSRVVVVIHAPRPPPPPPTPKKAAGGGGAKSKSPSNGGRSTGSGATSSKTATLSAAVPPGAVLERWVFDVSSFPAWPGGAEAMRGFEGDKRIAEDEELVGEGGEGGEGGEVEVEVEVEDEDEVEVEDEDEDEDDSDDDEDRAALIDDAVNWADVEEQLRGALRRLSHTGEKMGPLPDGCTFTVAVELRDEAKAPIGVMINLAKITLVLLKHANIF
ncbi:uncharacterized protein E0L32_000548 [Thyridium curvatum]|uniref:HORMA domain-containing protein n=1 Tax=Thyridium curvatum TaxID=1093900 RepID=A0A507B608_9PEZI|nr:uncharacterized protein E0L32_000548 [Thyridium curvatum]TPX14154.1 hypothetical protein E0L32_000548 [Thyridium curvatum]